MIWVSSHTPALEAGDVNVLRIEERGKRIDFASWVSLKNVQLWGYEMISGDEILRERDYTSPPPKGWHKAAHDPFAGRYISLKTLRPVTAASMAILNGSDVYYLPL